MPSPTISHLICSMALITLIFVMQYSYLFIVENVQIDMAKRELKEVADYVSNTIENLRFLASSSETTSIEATNLEDAVDNSGTDVDGVADKGTHSNFANQRSGPDSVYDNLTEWKTAGGYSNTTLLNDGFEAADWDANWDNIAHNWQEDSSPVHSGSASAWAADGYEGNFTCDNLDTSGATAIYVDFWFRKDDTDSTDFTLFYYDGSSYDLIDELNDNGGDDTWLHYTQKIIDSQYFKSNFRIRFDATLGSGENVWIDDVVITREILIPDNYELNLEVEFTNVDCYEDNEAICIYAGATGSEDIKVYVWNASDSTWYLLFNDLTAYSWNNKTVTNTITSPTVTLRFLGGTETSDTSPDSWQIDIVLLHSWSPAKPNYVSLEKELSLPFAIRDSVYVVEIVGSGNNASSISVYLKKRSFVRADSWLVSGLKTLGLDYVESGEKKIVAGCRREDADVYVWISG